MNPCERSVAAAIPPSRQQAHYACMLVRLAPWLLALLLAAPAAAGQVTIYRCTEADGSLALQDSPCAPGEQQQVLKMERPQDPPPEPEPAPEPEPDPVATAQPATVITRVVVVDPPPPVYECVTPDGEHYTSANPAGNPRWVPLWTLGHRSGRFWRGPAPRSSPDPGGDDAFLHNDLVFDGIGRPAPEPTSDRPGAPRLPPAVGLARTPGTWIRDRCHPLPPAAACTALRDKRDQLREQHDRSTPNEREYIDAELAAVEARLALDC